MSDDNIDIDPKQVIVTMVKALRVNRDFLKFLGDLNEEGILLRGPYSGALELFCDNFNVVVDESQEAWQYVDMLE